MQNKSTLAFRDQAQQQTASTDSFKTPVAVVDLSIIRMTIALATFVLLVTIWAAWTKVPIQIAGTGVIVTKGQPLSLPVEASNSGQVVSVMVSNGQPINAGDMIAKLSQPLLQAQLDQAKVQLQETLDKREQTLANLNAEQRINQQSRTDKRNALEKAIFDLQSRLPYLREQEKQLAALANKGLVSRDQATNAAIKRQTADEDLSQQQAQLKQLEVDAVNEQDNRQQRLLSLDQSIEQARENLSIRQTELDNNIDIIAEQAGVIDEINVIRGDWVGTGQRIAIISPRGELNSSQHLALSALIYVPIDKGKQLSAGMPALLEVSSILKGSFGKVKATVTEVSDLAIAEDTLSLRLNNPSLEKKILAEGAPFEVIVDLDIDPNEISGYAWTQTPGPKIELTAGTFIEASITEQYKSLLSLVIPQLKILFQLD